MTGNGLFSLLLALLLFGGCVKENREECPCRLLVDLSEVDSLKIPVVDISVAGANEFLFSSHKPVGESNEEMILVPRGRLNRVLFLLCERCSCQNIYQGKNCQYPFHVYCNDRVFI